MAEMSGGREAIEKFPAPSRGRRWTGRRARGEAAELAASASDRAPFLTGAVIRIDGGLTATTVTAL